MFSINKRYLPVFSDNDWSRRKTSTTLKSLSVMRTMTRRHIKGCGALRCRLVNTLVPFTVWKLHLQIQFSWCAQNSSTHCGQLFPTSIFMTFFQSVLHPWKPHSSLIRLSFIISLGWYITDEENIG